MLSFCYVAAISYYAQKQARLPYSNILRPSIHYLWVEEGLPWQGEKWSNLWLN